MTRKMGSKVRGCSTSAARRHMFGLHLLLVVASLLVGNDRIQSVSISSNNQIGQQQQQQPQQHLQQDRNPEDASSRGGFELSEQQQQQQQQLDQEIAASSSAYGNRPEGKILKSRTKRPSSTTNPVESQILEQQQQQQQQQSDNYEPQPGQYSDLTIEDFGLSPVDRRFGLFKNSQNSNGLYLSPDCERCMNGPSFGGRPTPPAYNAAGSQIYSEPPGFASKGLSSVVGQPSSSYYYQQAAGSFGPDQQLGHPVPFGSKLKSKFNSKFPFSKPSFGDMFQGGNKFGGPTGPGGKQLWSSSLKLKGQTGQQGGYMMPLAGVVPLKYQQPYYCVQQTSLPYEPLASSPVSGIGSGSYKSNRLQVAPEPDNGKHSRGPYASSVLY